jgi:hypothetical protein
MNRHIALGAPILFHLTSTQVPYDRARQTCTTVVLNKHMHYLAELLSCHTLLWCDGTLVELRNIGVKVRGAGYEGSEVSEVF